MDSKVVDERKEYETTRGRTGINVRDHLSKEIRPRDHSGNYFLGLRASSFRHCHGSRPERCIHKPWAAKELLMP